MICRTISHYKILETLGSGEGSLSFGLDLRKIRLEQKGD